MNWQDKVVSPAKALEKIEPGMKIFLGTGVAEPRMLIRQLIATDASNIQDLELIQLVSLGDLITMKELKTQKFRLKTFFSGWVASEAITGGLVDLIPSRFSFTNLPRSLCRLPNASCLNHSFSPFQNKVLPL